MTEISMQDVRLVAGEGKLEAHHVLDAVNVILRQRVERSRQWQPIETLPKDGRRVLAYRPLAMETGDETITVVQTTKSPTTSPQGVKHWTSRWCHPTHWMDIPALPTTDPIITSTNSATPDTGAGHG